MNEILTITGGARVGRANMSYPFCDLYVDKDVLKINASVLGLLVFQPKDIHSIDAISVLPFLGRGIQIFHNIPNYNERIIFWTLENPNTVLEKIKNTGFLDNQNSPVNESIVSQQNQGSAIFKKPAIIFFIALWNILLLPFILRVMFGIKLDFLPFIPPYVAPLFFLCCAVLALASERFRVLILQKGVELDDIKKFLYFVILLSTIFTLSYTSVKF
jgi:hypothetical protein